MEDGRFPSQVQDLIFDSYPHSHKAVSVRLGRRSQNIFFLNLMLNWKNNENDAVFDKFAKKKKKIEN